MKYLTGLILGIALHIAALEGADLIMSSRFISCAEQDTTACLQIMFGDRTALEEILTARPQLGLKRWNKYVKEHNIHAE